MPQNAPFGSESISLSIRKSAADGRVDLRNMRADPDLKRVLMFHVQTTACGKLANLQAQNVVVKSLWRLFIIRSGVKMST